MEPVERFGLHPDGNPSAVTSAGEVRQVAHAARRHPGLEVLTRVGFLGFGITHLLVAWIAVQLAFGRAPADGDQTGAFQLLGEGPLGTLLLITVAVGLAAMAFWQVLEAGFGHLDVKDAERTGERLMSAGRAVAYGFFSFYAAKVLTAPTSTGSQDKQQAAGTLLSKPGGPVLVGAIGVGIVALSLGLAWYGLSRRFERHLRTGEMTWHTRRTVRTLGVVGYSAKSVAYAIVGALVITAAMQHDPTASRGLDAALRTLAQQPWGDRLLYVVASGFTAYGLFTLAQSRYRKV